jgi:hypothetical protein
MYLFEDMVDMALPKGIKWPTEYHRKVAINLLIANPSVTTLNAIQNGVLNVLSISKGQIDSINLDELRNFDFEYPIPLRCVT